jgi:hypothetical protein
MILFTVILFYNIISISCVGVIRNLQALQSFQISSVIKPRLYGKIWLGNLGIISTYIGADMVGTWRCCSAYQRMLEAGLGIVYTYVDKDKNKG